MYRFCYDFVIESFNYIYQIYLKTLYQSIYAVLLLSVGINGQAYVYIINLLQAEDLILKGFPEKIIALNQLLETPQFNEKDLSKVHHDLNIPIPEPITFNR